jgi:hypothetical protein
MSALVKLQGLSSNGKSVTYEADQIVSDAHRHHFVHAALQGHLLFSTQRSSSYCACFFTSKGSITVASSKHVCFSLLDLGRGPGFSLEVRAAKVIEGLHQRRRRQESL